VPTGGPAERQAWLRARIDELLGSPALKKASVGVAVMDVDSGRVLYTRGEKTPLNPASNAKLVTTAAALAVLGPEYRFKTVLYADQVRGTEIVGNLYLRGFGDPSFVTEGLWKLVSDLYATGIRKVSGDVVIDDTFFDTARLPPAYEQKEEDAPWRAPTGAASLNYNVVAVTVSPAPQDGAAVRVTLEPPTSYVLVENHARTAKSGPALVTVTGSEHGEQTLVTITGRIGRGAEPRTFYKRVLHPELYLGWTLRDFLIRRGIKLGGRGVQKGVAPAGARALVSHASEPLSVLIRDVNKRSNNFMAEQILKTMGAEAGGRPGTWKKGQAALTRWLDEAGVARGAYVMQNGSGLYDADRLTPQTIVQVLRQIYRDFRLSADYVASLAVAGADGTVSTRMEGGGAERYVRAKTGTLEGISCLSGFAGAASHAPVAFSILMNNLPAGSGGEARRVQDGIAELLVAYLEAQAP
jgi:D-alanyl-D-alanine carboxypeptidase/D-alanyl-D-alanine-endopeptidase (penicillin-binding protein 4)